MSRTPVSHCCLLLVWTLISISFPAHARADAAEHFHRLNDQCWELMDAGNLREAERLALQLMRIAEGPLANDQDRVATAFHTLGAVYDDQGRYTEAETLYRRSLAIDKQLLGPDDPRVANTLNSLALVYENQGRYGEAEPLLTRSLAIRERVLGPDDLRVADSLNNLAILHRNQGRCAAAESLHKRSLVIRENALGAEHPVVADSLNNLAILYSDQARYAEAESLNRRALAIREKAFGHDHIDVATSLNSLAEVLRVQGRYAEAEPLYRRSIAIRQKVFGPDHLNVADSLNNLALLFHDRGHYAEAEPLYQRSLEITEKVLGHEHARVANSLNNFAILYEDQGRYAEAEPLYRHSLAIREKVLGANHPDVADSLNNLGVLYRDEGRYADAKPLYERSLAIREKELGPEHPDVAVSLNNLANLYHDQGFDAEPLHKRSLAIREKALGPDHPEVAMSLNNLASLYDDTGRHVEAEPLYKRSLAIRERVLGPDHPDVAQTLGDLAVMYWKVGHYREAEPLYERSLAVYEKALGPQHPQVARSLGNLALLYSDEGRYEEAEPLADRAIAILARRGEAGAVYGKTGYLVRAEVHWGQRKRQMAIADLRDAMQFTEQYRAQTSGGEVERAAAFAYHGLAFEKMVAWQEELGGTGDAFDALERSRARGLLDQIETRGLDLLAGVPIDEAEELRRREREANTQVASLQKQIELLDQRRDLAEEKRKAEQERLREQLRRAQANYATVYADIRNASPAYRLAVGKDLKPVPLEKLQQWVTDQNALLLEYLAGWEGGYVLVVPAKGEARLEKLALDEAQAKALGTDAGPLTGERLSKALTNEEGTGALDLLRKADSEEAAQEVTPALSTLWQVLIPESEREAILAGKYQRLIVLPDGPLARLPFETLVVRAGEKPQYLLDVGPPIQYAPSATILINLAERREQSGIKNLKAREPVLTVGDCRYGPTAKPKDEDVLAQLAPRARLATLYGNVEPLYYSKWEVAWVSEVFGKQGTQVASLKGDQATEAAVRSSVPGRRVLDFSCHGLVDESYGNLFGALVLTPGPRKDDSANDGLLTLAEVYELDLKGCELAILSACQTNAGPEQRGEGIWALSRGFLVAGSRRVVASNWLVDDEAGASLVSYYCSILAKAQQQGPPPDHAEALWQAKRWARTQEKWTNPYYWGTFVLIGPD